MTLKYRAQSLRVMRRGACVGEKYDIDTAQSFLAHPKCLPGDTLEPVTDHGAARALARDRDAETGMGERIRAPVYRDLAGGAPLSALEHMLELCRLQQPV